MRGRVQDRILEALDARGWVSTKAQISADVRAHPQSLRLKVLQSDVTNFAKDLAKRGYIVIRGDTWTLTPEGQFLYRSSTKSKK